MFTWEPEIGETPLAPFHVLVSERDAHDDPGHNAKHRQHKQDILLLKCCK